MSFIIDADILAFPRSNAVAEHRRRFSVVVVLLFCV